MITHHVLGDRPGMQFEILESETRVGILDSERKGPRGGHAPRGTRHTHRCTSNYCFAQNCMKATSCTNGKRCEAPKATCIS